jgi:hypothetical protein
LKASSGKGRDQKQESTPRKSRGLPLPACDNRRGLGRTRRLLPWNFQPKNGDAASGVPEG